MHRGQGTLARVAGFRYVVTDVFTDRPLAGNQLAVFTDARDLPEDVLQPLARELNLSETVYVYPAEADGHVRIRIFTPARELPFAGHPILGTAFVLAGPLSLGELRLETGAGVIPVRLDREDGRIAFGRMEQPVPTVKAFDGDEPALLRALGVDRSELPIEVYDNGAVFVVRLPAESRSRCRADAGLLVPRDAHHRGRRELLRRGREELEDAHVRARLGRRRGSRGRARPQGPLAVHLARHGAIAFGDEIEIAQGVEVDRPCTLYARVEGSAERVERVEVGGSAVIVARGEFSL